MVTWLPAAYTLGRAVFYVVFGLYFLWAATTIGRWPAQLRTDRTALVVWLLMLATFALGLLAAPNPGKAIEAWLRYTLYSSVFFITTLALQLRQDNLLRLARGLAVSLAVMIAYLSLKLVIDIGHAESFEPTQQMKEDNLPWLWGFGLFVLVAAIRGRTLQLGGMLLLSAVIYAYIIGSQGRAALFGALVAAGVLIWLVLDRRERYALISFLAVALTAATLLTDITRQRAVTDAYNSSLDSMTSGRTVLWEQAIRHPPPNPLIGTGLANVEFHTEVITIGQLGRVRGLHNFVLDAWYETGWLGLAALAAWLGLGLARGVRAWRRQHDPQLKRLAGVCLAGAGAILSSGLFSFTYHSVQFIVFLPLLFAAVSHLALHAKPSVDQHA